MKLIWIAALVPLVFACSDKEPDSAGEEPAPKSEAEETSPTVPVEESASTAPQPETVAAILPFDMPIMPGGKILSTGKFVDTKRRGKEAIAAFVAKATPIEVAAFYAKALEDNGFTATLGKHNSESTAKVSGVRANGESFTVTTMRGGSKAGEGESQSGVVANIPK